jgi:O-antigen/teichoic acid export membrane protein
MNRLTLFALLALVGVLLLAGVAVWLWRRFYRDDAHNTVRRIFKNSTVPLATRIIVRALDFIFFLVLYSTLPATEIFPYTLAALLVAQYLNTFTEFGLGVLLTREVAREPSAGQQLFGITLLLRWLLVLAAVPMAAGVIGGYELIAALNLGEEISQEGQQVIWILLLTLVPGAYSGAVTALYHAAERMEVPAVVELITAVLSMLARITLLLLGFGILGLAWAAVGVSSLTALIYLGLQMRSFFRPTLGWNSALARSLLWLALPLMLNNLLGNIFFRFDTFIIKAFGPGDGDLLGQQYAITYQILNIAMILPPVITFAVFPLLSRKAAGDRQVMAQAQNRTLHLLLLLAFPIAMGLCVLAPDLIRLFTQENAAQYLPISAHVLAILAWFLPLSFVNGLVQYVLIAVNRQHAITRAFVIGALFNLGTNLLTIPWFGLYAASIITILSEVVLYMVFLPLLRQEGLVPPLFALAWRPALAALAMGAAMLLAGMAGWLIAALVAAPVYAVVLWLLGGLGAEEVALARRLLGRTP